MGAAGAVLVIAPRLSLRFIRAMLRSSILRTENVPVARNRSVSHSTFRGDLQTIHLPEVNLSAIVAPENVALAVTVVVADVLDVPIRRDGSVRGSALRFDLQAIHLPQIDLPGVVPPKNIALQVAVEVADAFDVPGGGDRSMRGSALRFDRQAVHLPE